jgi:hypothetical protein
MIDHTKQGHAIDQTPDSTVKVAEWRPVVGRVDQARSQLIAFQKISLFERRFGFFDCDLGQAVARRHSVARAV